MPICIRNEKTEKLTREVALLTGENITTAITHSLEEWLNKIKTRKAITNLTQEIMDIFHRCKVLPDIDPRIPDEILGYRFISLNFDSIGRAGGLSNRN
jgi:hypothetical protein